MKHFLQRLQLLCLLACLCCTTTATAQSVFINEIHYDNASTDVNEAIEIMGPAGTDLTGWSLVLYNGSNGSVYNTNSLSGEIPGDGVHYHGFVVVNYPSNGIQNGSPDGIALVNGAGEVVQFLSYEGTMTAIGGPADGMTSQDIGVSETGTEPENFSLQLAGGGGEYPDFTWEAASESTFGGANTNQILPLGGDTDPDPEPEPEPQPSTTIVFINEIHYDNASTDTGEGVEIAGLAGTDLSGWQLIGYNGNNGASYSTTNLSGIIPAQQSGFGTVFFPIAGLQNGSPDGIALVDAAGEVVQFLSYEGAFSAVGGPADGMMSTDIEVAQPSDSPVGYSLQLTGAGSAYADFTWAPSSASTYGAVNTGQTFLPLQDVVFINEIHYDNDGTDANEGVEVAGNAGADLSGWQLVAYNGNGGGVYATINMSGIIPNQDNGYGAIFFPVNGLQNGAPDGLALVNPDGEVVEFLSYEGAMIATAGPANGLTSEAIGVTEGSSTPVNFSLQLTGTGTAYRDFTWSGPIASTYNAINTGQSFGGGTSNPDPEEPQEGSIAEARTLPVGTAVTVSGVLTATDQFGGPAYLQDETGGIAVYDQQVHAPDAFAIGDSIQITATVELFNQMPELVNVTELENFGPASAPIEPVVTSIAALGQLEGRLITIPDASFVDTDGLLFPESNYQITDATGTLALRIDAEDLVGRLKPQEPVTITGVLSSFRGSLQLLPRFQSDLPGTESYEPAGSDIPISTTLDVMTWNMEFFGATQPDFGPNNEELQLQNAARLLDSVRADIIAVQEVSDENQLQQLVDMLPGYARICSDRYSYSFNGPDPSFPAQKLCFIYNTEVISVVDDRVIFEELYDAARAGQTDLLNNYPSGDASSFWSSGRLPYMLTVDATVEGVTERIHLINIHAKSGSGFSDLSRRAYDVQALKDTLDQYYPNANLILLGDYNDDVDASIGSGETAYQLFMQAEDYDVLSYSLSAAGMRSYITQDNVIDHITISNELFDEYLPGSEALVIPFNYITNYVNTTSDHLPVVARFELTPLAVDAGNAQTVYFGYAPQACATLTASTATGGSGVYTYTWSNGQTGQRIQVCPEETTVYTVTVTDSEGRTITDTVQVCVVNVSCTKGNGEEKVEICHSTSGKKNQTICVPVHAVEGFLQRGATFGSCGTSTSCDAETPEPVATAAPEASLSAYPNPVQDYVEVRLEGAEEGELQVVLYDKVGNSIYSGKLQARNGSARLDLRGKELKSGTYYLKVVSQQTTQTVRMIKE
ncbi:T9SS type A sorting domain-containing protein [Pontibacter korlensis]|uniref:LTD domain-containing protein n=1 Tax=Pontibacter korlensis TaxID=400092 RepID=A0A0E3UYH0_9BACT|nr:T9SS type A sorting domain-containing protein [Pontibacter korlensis]AKD05112.1 hypothetical protein PKOR_21095 [Pontibacter korlensis]